MDGSRAEASAQEDSHVAVDALAAAKEELSVFDNNTITDDDILAEESMPWYCINLKLLMAFTGPGWLMSIAYLDPGNLESDLQAGAYGGYSLIWVLFVATCAGCILQILAARLGVVTGKNLAELCREEYSRPVSLLLWVMTEIAIIGSDIQEVVGSAIAFQVLFGIPLWLGCLITGADTFTFLLIQIFGVRKLEFFFAFLIGVMLIAFYGNFVEVQPDGVEIVQGFLPTVPDYALTQAVGILGAVIMPHNIYLHSALVQSRRVDRKNVGQVRVAAKYFAYESAFALLISFFINLAIVAVFASGFFNEGCAELGKACVPFPKPSCANKPAFVNASLCTTDAGVVGTCDFIGLRSAGSALKGLVGKRAATIIWGVGLLAAGQSSTMTGTYAGQFVMEGFLKIKIAAWKRVALTRSIALGPALAVALIGSSYGSETNSKSCHPKFNAAGDQFDEWLNVLQSIQMPFALLPLLCFTSDQRLMGSFASPAWLSGLCWMLTLFVLVTNFDTVIQQILPVLNGFGYVLAFVLTALYFVLIFVVSLKDFERLFRYVRDTCGAKPKFPSSEEERLLDSETYE